MLPHCIVQVDTETFEPSEATDDPVYSSAQTPLECALDSAIEARTQRDGTYAWSSGVAPAQRQRLRLYGRELSEEFHRYAERVARGEVLGPFSGPLLAEEERGPATERLPALVSSTPKRAWLVPLSMIVVAIGVAVAPVPDLSGARGLLSRVAEYAGELATAAVGESPAALEQAAEVAAPGAAPRATPPAGDPPIASAIMGLMGQSAPRSSEPPAGESLGDRAESGANDPPASTVPAAAHLSEKARATDSRL